MGDMISLFEVQMCCETVSGLDASLASRDFFLLPHLLKGSFYQVGQFQVHSAVSCWQRGDFAT